jgi:hypothetical protein
MGDMTVSIAGPWFVFAFYEMLGNDTFPLPAEVVSLKPE